MEKSKIVMKIQNASLGSTELTIHRTIKLEKESAVARSTCCSQVRSFERLFFWGAKLNRLHTVQCARTGDLASDPNQHVRISYNTSASWHFTHCINRFTHTHSVKYTSNFTRISSLPMCSFFVRSHSMHAYAQRHILHWHMCVCLFACVCADDSSEQQNEQFVPHFLVKFGWKQTFLVYSLSENQSLIFSVRNSFPGKRNILRHSIWLSSKIIQIAIGLQWSQEIQ